jgi:hypothetical protein
MSLAQYLKMWTWIKQWQSQNNTKNLPNYVDVSSLKIGLDRIEKDVYLDMFHRVGKYQEGHEGKMPETIGINSPAHGTEPPITPVKNRLEAGLGPFNNFTEFWEKIKGRGYKHYYNNVYNLKQEIQRVINREGINCTDSMQLCHALGCEMGYEVQYVHVMCKKGGHIRGQIKGHEFTDWTDIDPAAALSVNSMYPIGRVWCDYPNAHITNAIWLQTD